MKRHQPVRRGAIISSLGVECRQAYHRLDPCLGARGLRIGDELVQHHGFLRPPRLLVGHRERLPGRRDLGQSERVGGTRPDTSHGAQVLALALGQRHDPAELGPHQCVVRACHERAL